MVEWLKDGAQNIQYFHRIVKGQQARRRISSLTCEDGPGTTDENKIKSEILGFYETLVGVADSSYSGGDVEKLSSLFSLKFGNNLQEFLAVGVSEEEMLYVIKQMPSNKAPGLDGYTVEFFRAAWNTVGSQVIAEVKEFFLSRQLLKEFNATAFLWFQNAHIQKRFTFFDVTLYINVYPKILANRIRRCLPSLIS